MADFTLAIFVAVCIIAVNVFLYYRYRDLRDRLEEKQAAERERKTKTIAHGVMPAGGTIAASAVQSDAGIADARAALADLRAIVEEDVSSLRESIERSSRKLEPTAS